MDPKLIDRINSQIDWTFLECQGLAAEFSLKTRYVIAAVLSQGKDYIDGPRPKTDLP